MIPTCVGTPMGTLTAMLPIAFPLSESTGLSPDIAAAKGALVSLQSRSSSLQLDSIMGKPVFFQGHFPEACHRPRLSLCWYVLLLTCSAHL